MRRLIFSIIATLAAIAAYATPPPALSRVHPQAIATLDLDPHHAAVNTTGSADSEHSTKALGLRYMSATATTPSAKIVGKLAASNEREKPDTVVTGARQNK